jgi:hypothetical protein
MLPRFAARLSEVWGAAPPQPEKDRLLQSQQLLDKHALDLQISLRLLLG